MNWKNEIESKELIEAIYSYLGEVYLMMPEDIDTMLDKHKEFDTYALIDGKGYGRFNLEGTTAFIADVVIISGGVDTIRQLIKLGRFKFPYATDIRFERAFKRRKNMRTFNINKYIKEVL